MQDLEKTISALKREIEHKNQVLDKRNDLYLNLEYENKQLEKTIKHLRTVLNEEFEISENYKRVVSISWLIIVILLVLCVFLGVK